LARHVCLSYLGVQKIVVFVVNPNKVSGSSAFSIRCAQVHGTPENAILLCEDIKWFVW